VRFKNESRRMNMFVFGACVSGFWYLFHAFRLVGRDVLAGGLGCVFVGDQCDGKKSFMVQIGLVLRS
jgi:hypothetical protein